MPASSIGLSSKGHELTDREEIWGDRVVVGGLINLYFAAEDFYSTGLRGSISSQGQVTIPKHVRDALDLNPGDRIEFAVRGGELMGRKKRDGIDHDGFVGIFADGRRTDDVLRELRRQHAWSTT